MFAKYDLDRSQYSSWPGIPCLHLISTLFHPSASVVLGYWTPSQTPSNERQAGRQEQTRQHIAILHSNIQQNIKTTPGTNSEAGCLQKDAAEDAEGGHPALPCRPASQAANAIGRAIGMAMHPFHVIELYCAAPVASGECYCGTQPDGFVNGVNWEVLSGYAPKPLVLRRGGGCIALPAWEHLGAYRRTGALWPCES